MKNENKERVSTKKSKEAVLKALEELPIVVVACKRAGIANATYYRWLKDDPDFAHKAEKAHRYGVNFINDLGESQLITMMKEKKYQALKYWLDNHHPDYDRRMKAIKPSPTGIYHLIQQLNAEDEKTKDS